MENIKLEHIYSLVENNQRITISQAVELYQSAPLFKIMDLAMIVKKRKSSDEVYFNRNFHLEPTNICKFNCDFCSYRKRQGEFMAWDMTEQEIREYCKEHYSEGITEVHLVGGVNPNHSLDHYKKIISIVRDILPASVAIKAFSAVEHIEMINIKGISFEQGIKELVEAGMDSVTGGGAEIFDEEIRQKICHEKATSKEWLDFHETAHVLGVKTNSTMLYGHIESVYHRIEHMNRLREVQDRTNGFLSFIPLKFRKIGRASCRERVCLYV